MARFEMLEAGFGAIGATAQADILFELGMMYATGRDCDVDIVAAHKWFNIAAIKGSDRAAEVRAGTVGDDVEGRNRPGAARSARMDDDALTDRISDEQAQCRRRRPRTLEKLPNRGTTAGETGHGDAQARS